MDRRRWVMPPPITLGRLNGQGNRMVIPKYLSVNQLVGLILGADSLQCGEVVAVVQEQAVMERRGHHVGASQ